MSEPFQQIETERLILRCVTKHDAIATSSLMTPEISRWLAYWPMPFTVAMAAARIETWRELAMSHAGLPFAVIEKSNTELIGWAIVSVEKENAKRGSLGFWLGEKYHNRGLMKELVPEVIAAGFEWLGLDVIEAGAQPDNAGSLAVMRACGMIRTGGRMVFAPARGRQEYCEFYEILRTDD